MLRLALTLVVVSIVGGCTFLLDFAPPVAADTDANVDAAAPDAMIDAMVDAQTVLNCAAAEPNDSISVTTLLVEGTLEAAICPNTDTDFYSFALAANVDLTITLGFDSSVSDLNLQVFNDTGTIIDMAATENEPEVITAADLPTGNYRVEVVSVAHNASLDYTLTLSRVPGV